MATINKKCWPKYFALVKSGKKKFELRLADFKVKPGDTFVLNEWNPKTEKFTGRKVSKKIKYIMKFKLDDFGQKNEIVKKGFYIIQF